MSTTEEHPGRRPAAAASEAESSGASAARSVPVPGGRPSDAAVSSAGGLQVIEREDPPPSQVNDALVVGLSVAAALCGVVFGIGVTLGWPSIVYGGAMTAALLLLGYAVRRYFTDRFPDVEAIEPRLVFDDASDAATAARPAGTAAAGTAGTTPGTDGDGDADDDTSTLRALPDVRPIGRRPVLKWTLVGSAGVVGAGLIAPVSTLGPVASRAEFERTPWRAGVRLVTGDGTPVRPEDIAVGGVSTVWPEGHVDEERASVLVLRLSQEPQPPTNPDWVVEESVLAYSKVCTHVGCPVALYREQEGALFCPCHQSTFDARAGARPVFGPAARALPQLPMGVDDEGYLVALGDFTEPVGPAYG